MRIRISASSIHLVMALILGSIITGCSHQLQRPTPEERQLLESSLMKMGPEYSHPRLVQAELLISVLDIRLEPASAEPELHIWTAGPLDYHFQQILADITVTPEPTQVFADSIYQNKIMYWNVLKAKGQDDPLTLLRRFEYLTFDWRPDIDRQAEHVAWHTLSEEIIKTYTSSEMFLEQDPALVDTVFSLLQDIPDPVGQAQALFDWVRDHMEYVYPPQARGVRSAFETRRGDCGQYSALFITMARIAGIPARQQSGFNFHPQAQSSHVWSEIFLPIKGWVPVDATREDGFLHLDNRRLISSTGMNIPLENAPDWATFENSEVQSGKTDFMQMYTLVMRGVQANFKSERNILRSVELE
jgi:hypothetical protein